MKYLLIIFLFLTLTENIFSQDSLSTEAYEFEPDKVAKEAVSKILSILA